MYSTITVDTPQGDSLTNITDEVREIVRESGVESGICFVVVPHTTAGITINSYMDPDTARDIIEEVRRIVPTRTDFQHQFDTPSDAAGHVKLALVDSSEYVLIEDGNLVLGHSQGLMLFDFDGPRTRRAHVKVIAG